MKKLTFVVFLIIASANNVHAQSGETELYSDFKKVDKELKEIQNQFLIQMLLLKHIVALAFKQIM